MRAATVNKSVRPSVNRAPRLAVLPLAVLPLLLVSRPAAAAEVTRVVSALDDDNLFDFNLTASWLHEIRTAYIKRESQEPPASDTELIKDLKYKQTRDILNLRMDFGVLWDIGIHVGLPIVLADSSTLGFDQSGGANCIYPGDPSGARPTCVNQANSTILRDGILPSDQAAGTWGINQRYRSPDTEVFKSPSRSGLPFLNVGITWAAMNQRRDDTKPTWTLNFDANLDTFKDMRFDPANPGGNTAVGLGYHQMIWSTWISKRFRHFDPYFGAWYMLPIRTNGSPFQKYPNEDGNDNQGAVNPQQQAGFTVGVEQIAWEDVPAKQRVTVEFRFNAQEHFYGREHSELWQPLSGSSACSASGATSACRPGIDTDLNGNATVGPYPGVTEIESYASFGGQLGLNVQVGKFARFRALGGFATDMPHFITGASAGVDRDHSGSVESQSTKEANPVYRETIDLPGRRFKVEGTQIWTLFVEGSLMF